jgi:predicted O-methyltransferase YrrM
MTSVLLDHRVASVLARLRRLSEVEDAFAKQRVLERERTLGGRVPTGEKYEIYGDAPPLSISPDVGVLLYSLVRARRPRLIVEFGASHGVATIHLAAALKDNNDGRLVTSEIRASKAEATRQNLAEAGLGALVDVLEGDALVTLDDIGGPIEMVFLDGRNDFYLPVLERLEPQLGENAVVIADLSADDPDLEPYLGYVRTSRNYTSVSMPLDAGVELSFTRTSLVRL